MGVEFADEHSWWIDEDEVRDFAEMKNMFPQTAPGTDGDVKATIQLTHHIHQ